MSRQSEYVPTLGVDKLLSIDEAVKIILEKEQCDQAMKKALVGVVRAGKVRVWLCQDGNIRYQYNPTSEG
jgi:hypothetical protein